MHIFANTKILGDEYLPEVISIILHSFRCKNGKYSNRRENVMLNIAKLDDGLDESPTVMVGEATPTKQLVKNRGFLLSSRPTVEITSAL